MTVSITYTRTDNDGQKHGGCLYVNPDRIEATEQIFVDAGYDTKINNNRLTMISDEEDTMIDEPAVPKVLAAVRVVNDIDPVVNPEPGTQVYHLTYGNGTVISLNDAAYLYVRFGKIIKRLDLDTRTLFPVLS